MNGIKSIKRRNFLKTMIFGGAGLSIAATRTSANEI